MKRETPDIGRGRLVPAWATAGHAGSRGEIKSPMGPGWLMASQGGGSGQKPKETARVQRRRRTSTEPRERAEAPRRERPSAPRPRPTSGGGGTGGFGGTGGTGGGGLFGGTGGTGGMGGTGVPGQSLLRNLPLGGRGMWLILGLLVVVCICGFLAMNLLGGGGGGSGDGGLGGLAPFPEATQPQAFATPVRPVATATRFVPAPAAASGEGQNWLVMLYQDADDKILEQDIYLDLNEAERAGSSERVQIVTQLDRYVGGYTADGNWHSTKRFHVGYDQDLGRLGSQEVADLGEVNMSDGASLVDFVTWAMENYPADKHVLILSDHGMGWPGGWSDPAPGGRGETGIPLANAIGGDHLYLMEMDQALEEIRARTGLEQFEMVGLDACLMGHVEVLTALAPHARYAVVSQETEPALGWAYTSFLQALLQNPDADGAELSRLIVDSYIEEDQRILDDQARAEFLRQGSPLGGLFGGFAQASPAQLVQQMGAGSTLTAVDLSAVPGLLDSLNDMSYVLQGANQSALARARTYALSFTSVFGSQVPPSYFDLGNLVQLFKEHTGDAQVAAAADGVLAAIDQAVIAEKHGSKKAGATGISIYYPNSNLYGNPVTGPQSYTAIASRFADASLWDDFLAFHYTGRSFQQGAAELVIPEGRSIEAPGLGAIDVGPIELSSDTAAPGQPVLISTDIQGENIGYVYLFVGFYDQAASSIFVADRDYLESSDTREVDGVYYPVWPEGGDFRLEFEWEPVVFAISDGTDSVVALFTPESYGRSFEEAVYTVDGIYTYANDGETRYARLYFSDGVLQRVYGFTGEEGTGSPWEIVPETGDQFTVLETWQDLDAEGNIEQISTQQGGTLTFGDQMFTWQDLDAAQGDYIVGFVVEDLDGNAYESYAAIRVE